MSNSEITMEFWHATTDAGRFRLEAFGATEADAMAALKIGIATHVALQWPYPEEAQTRKERTAMLIGDSFAEPRRLGAAYRDGSQL